MTRSRRWLWWTLGLVGLALALYTAFPGVPVVGRDDASGLGGTWTVNGVDLTGAEYSGTLVVRATDDPDRYDLEWIVTGPVRTGTGRQQGDRFDVTWTAESSAAEPVRGTGSYRIEGDGRMTGTWTVGGQDGTGTEEIFPEA